MKLSGRNSSFSLKGLFVLVIYWLCLFSSHLHAQFTTQKENGRDVIVLLDRSGSMLQNDPNGLAIPAIQAIVEEMTFLKGKSRILIIPFGSTLDYIPYNKKNKKGYFSNDYNFISSLLEKYDRVNPVTNQTFTDLEAALVAAKQRFRQDSNSEAEKHIIIVTDGFPLPPPTGKYKKLKKRRQRSEASIKNILRTVETFPRDNINTTFIGLFKKQSSDYKFALQFVEDYREKCITRFIEVESPEKIIESVIDFFPRNEQVLDLYKGAWKKTLVFPDELLIKELHAYIVMGKNRIKNINVSGIFDHTKIVNNKNGNIAFVSAYSLGNTIRSAKKLSFTPKIYIKGRSGLKADLKIDPYSNLYSSGDNITFHLKLYNEDTEKEVKYEKVFCTFRTPGRSEPVYFSGDSARFTIPAGLGKTNAKLDMEIIIANGIKLTKTLNWKISDEIENTFVITPKLPIIDFGELGNQQKITFSKLKNYRISLAQPSLKVIRPVIRFDFDDGLPVNEWFPGRYRIAPIKRVDDGRNNWVSLPEITIQVPATLDPYFENKKYTGNIIISAQGVQDFYIPFAFVFKRPAWDMEYAYETIKTGEKHNEKNILAYMNLFNVFFNELSLPLKHNSGYLQKVSVTVDSTLQFRNSYIETRIAKLLTKEGQPTNIEIEGGETKSFRYIFLKKIDKLLNTFYSGKIVVSGERLPSILINIRLLNYKNHIAYLIIFFPFLLTLFIILKNKSRNDAILSLRNLSEIALPASVSSSSNNVSENNIWIPDSRISNQDLRFTSGEYGEILVNNPTMRQINIRHEGSDFPLQTGSRELMQGDQVELISEEGDNLACEIMEVEARDGQTYLRCNFFGDLLTKTESLGKAVLFRLVMPFLILLTFDYFVGSSGNMEKEIMFASTFYLSILLIMFTFYRWGYRLLFLIVLLLLIVGV